MCNSAQSITNVRNPFQIKEATEKEFAGQASLRAQRNQPASKLFSLSGVASVVNNCYLWCDRNMRDMICEAEKNTVASKINTIQVPQPTLGLDILTS